MINRFFSAIASALQQLFGVIIASPLEERRFVSKSVATGLFWAFTPTVFFQQAAIVVYWALVRKSFLNFHFPIAWLVTWVSNPWTIFILYPFYYWFGGFVLPQFGHRSDIEFTFRWQEGAVEFYRGIEPVFPQLFVGSLAVSILASGCGYVATYVAVTVFWQRKNSRGGEG